MSARPVLAIDIGGTKVAVAVVAPDGRLLSQRVLPTPSGEPRAAVSTILAEARAASRPHGVAAAGIALPAVVEDGRVRWAADSIAGWDGLPLAAIATESLGVPTVVEFDGYAATIGEARRGAGRGLRDVAVVIAGTGVGAGIVHHGRLYRGAIGVAGGLGWMRWPTEDGLSAPLESVASGPAILAAARSAAAGGAAGAVYADTAAVFAAAAEGDPSAAAAVERACRALASGVGAIVALLAPQAVVLGGGVGSRPDVVAEVRDLVLATTQPHAATAIRIVPSALGSLSSLHGAACLAAELIQPRPSQRPDRSPKE